MNRQVVLNASFIWLGRIAGVIISFFLTPFMLHRLGVEPMGLLSLAASFSVAGGFMSLLDLGMQGALVVFVARSITRKDWSALGELLSTALAQYALLGLLAALTLLLMSDTVILSIFKLSAPLIPTARVIFRLAAVQVALEFIATVPQAAMEGKQNYRLTQGFAVGLNLLIASATVMVISLGWGVVAVAGLQCCGSLIRLVTLGFVMVRQYSAADIRLTKFSWRVWRELFQFSRPLLGQSLSGLIFRQTDRVIVGSFLSVALVAHYNIIQNLYRSTMLFQSFSPVMAPATTAAQHSLAQLRRMFFRNTKYSTWLTSAVAMTAVVLLPWLLQHWVGEAFVYLTPLASVYLFNAVGASFIGVGQAMMTPLGRARETMIYGLIGGIISFVGSLVTVSRWQLAGIIWTTALGMSVSWALHLRLFKRELLITWKDILFLVVARAYGPISMATLGLWLVSRFFVPANLWAVFMYGGVTMIVQGILFYVLGLERTEQATLNKAVCGRLAYWQTLLTARKSV